MTPNQFWLTVWAVAIGCGLVIALIAGGAAAAKLIIDARRSHPREDFRPPPSVRPTTTTVDGARHAVDEPVDEGKLRIAVRRSTSEMPTHRTLLVEPPMIEGVTLFAYLKHHAPQSSELAWDSESGGVLARVTEAMYQGVERDPTVAPVFHSYDGEHLRRHFVRFLVELTQKGLDVRRADALGEAHEHLAIAPEQFDAVIGHFVQALKAYLQPHAFEHVMPQLGKIVEPLRRRIVSPNPATVAR